MCVLGWEVFCHLPTTENSYLGLILFQTVYHGTIASRRSLLSRALRFIHPFIISIIRRYETEKWNMKNMLKSNMRWQWQHDLRHIVAQQQQQQLCIFHTHLSMWKTKSHFIPFQKLQIVKAQITHFVIHQSDFACCVLGNFAFVRCDLQSFAGVVGFAHESKRASSMDHEDEASMASCVQIVGLYYYAVTRHSQYIVGTISALLCSNDVLFCHCTQHTTRTCPFDVWFYLILLISFNLWVAQLTHSWRGGAFICAVRVRFMCHGTMHIMKENTKLMSKIFTEETSSFHVISTYIFKVSAAENHQFLLKLNPFEQNCSTFLRIPSPSSVLNFYLKSSNVWIFAQTINYILTWKTQSVRLVEWVRLYYWAACSNTC